MNLEHELHNALRREPAPLGFKERVLARTAHAHTANSRRPAILALAAALALAAVIPPVASEYRDRREARGIEAARELVVALQITQTKLRQTEERIQRPTRHPL